MLLLDDFINVVFDWNYFWELILTLGLKLNLFHINQSSFSISTRFNGNIYICFVFRISAFYMRLLDFFDGLRDRIFWWNLTEMFICMIIWSVIIFSLTGILLVSNLNFNEQSIDLSCCFPEKRGVLCDLSEWTNEHTSASFFFIILCYVISNYIFLYDF